MFKGAFNQSSLTLLGKLLLNDALMLVMSFMAVMLLRLVMMMLGISCSDESQYGNT